MKVLLPSKNHKSYRLRILLRVWIGFGLVDIPLATISISNHPNHPSNTQSPYPQRSSIMDWKFILVAVIMVDTNRKSLSWDTKYLTSSQIENSYHDSSTEVWEDIWSGQRTSITAMRNWKWNKMEKNCISQSLLKTCLGNISPKN